MRNQSGFGIPWEGDVLVLCPIQVSVKAAPKVEAIKLAFQHQHDVK